MSNPESGANRKDPHTLRKLQTPANPFPVFHREAQFPSEIASVLHEFAYQGVNTVLINGGDGTVQMVLTALHLQKPFEQSPLLAVLRAGTTSMIAGDIGLKGPRVKAVTRFLKWIETGNVRATIHRRSVMRLQIHPEKAPLFGMFFGAGLIYSGIHYSRQYIHTLGVRGELGAGLALTRFLWAMIQGKHRRIPLEGITVGLDQQPLFEAHECAILSISTLQRLFWGLYPYWGLEEAPLHYTHIEASARPLLRALPSLLRGRRANFLVPQNGYLSHNVYKAQLHLESGFTLDGEMFSPGDHSSVMLSEGGQVSFIRL